MKLLYLAPVYINEQQLDGVAKKVLNHVTVFLKWFDVYMMSYGDEGVVIRHNEKTRFIGLGGVHRRYALYREAEKLAESEKIECVYIRYPKSENNFIQLLKKLHLHNSKIVSKSLLIPIMVICSTALQLQLLMHYIELN